MAERQPEGDDGRQGQHGGDDRRQRGRVGVVGQLADDPDLLPVDGDRDRLGPHRGELGLVQGRVDLGRGLAPGVGAVGQGGRGHPVDAVVVPGVGAGGGHQLPVGRHVGPDLARGWHGARVVPRLVLVVRARRAGSRRRTRRRRSAGTAPRRRSPGPRPRAPGPRRAAGTSPHRGRRPGPRRRRGPARSPRRGSWSAPGRRRPPVRPAQHQQQGEQPPARRRRRRRRVMPTACRTAPGRPPPTASSASDDHRDHHAARRWTGPRPPRRRHRRRAPWRRRSRTRGVVRRGHLLGGLRRCPLGLAGARTRGPCPCRRRGATVPVSPATSHERGGPAGPRRSSGDPAEATRRPRTPGRPSRKISSPVVAAGRWSASPGTRWGRWSPRRRRSRRSPRRRRLDVPPVDVRAARR